MNFLELFASFRFFSLLFLLFEISYLGFFLFETCLKISEPQKSIVKQSLQSHPAITKLKPECTSFQQDGFEPSLCFIKAAIKLASSNRCCTMSIIFALFQLFYKSSLCISLVSLCRRYTRKQKINKFSLKFDRQQLTSLNITCK